MSDLNRTLRDVEPSAPLQSQGTTGALTKSPMAEELRRQELYPNLMRGSPKSNRGLGKHKEWQNALNWALDNYDVSPVQRGAAVRCIALRLVDMAVNGDIRAIDHIRDSLDGKPTPRLDDDETGDYIVLIRR